MNRWLVVGAVAFTLAVGCKKDVPIDGEFSGECNAQLDYYLTHAGDSGTNTSTVTCSVKIKRVGDQAEVTFMGDPLGGKFTCTGMADVGSGENLVVTNPTCKSETEGAGEMCKFSMKPLTVKLELEPEGKHPITASPSFELAKDEPKKSGCALDSIVKLSIHPTKLKPAKK